MAVMVHAGDVIEVNRNRPGGSRSGWISLKIGDFSAEHRDMNGCLFEDILVHRPSPEVQVKSFVPYEQKRAYWDAHKRATHGSPWAEQEGNVSDNITQVREVESIRQFRRNPHEVEPVVKISRWSSPTIFNRGPKFKSYYFLSVGDVGTSLHEQILSEGYKRSLDRNECVSIYSKSVLAGFSESMGFYDTCFQLSSLVNSSHCKIMCVLPASFHFFELPLHNGLLTGHSLPLENANYDDPSSKQHDSPSKPNHPLFGTSNLIFNSVYIGSHVALGYGLCVLGTWTMWRRWIDRRTGWTLLHIAGFIWHGFIVASTLLSRATSRDDYGLLPINNLRGASNCTLELNRMPGGTHWSNAISN
jgi:hypothetical protein